MKNIIPEKAKNIMQKLIDNGYEAVICGGFVRDILLEKNPKDVDIFSNITGKEILSIFPNSKVLGGVERQEKILTVIVDGIEVSQYRSNGNRTETGNNLKTHCSTCDFTINSIAMDINGKIIDYFNGQEDLKNKILKCVGNPRDRINEDILRVLRGIRFVCKYNFDFERKTNNAILYCPINTLPPERIREEFLKIIQYDNGIEKLHEYGLLKQIIPELYHENNFKDGGDHHDETPFEHMCNSFKEACKITDNVLVRLACLLHDLGKGISTSYKPNTLCDKNEHIRSTGCVGIKNCIGNNINGDLCPFAEIHFYQHETIGCDLAKEFMLRFKFSNEDIKYVSTLIGKHMYSFKAEPSKKSYVKFFNTLEQNNITIYEYITLIYCDHQGNMAKKRLKFGNFLNGNFLLQHYWDCKFNNNTPFTVKDLKVSGKDLIDLGIPEGKLIGDILKRIYDDVIDGVTKNDRPTLMNLIRQQNKPHFI